jgi:tRNA(fMet)-specific endonuclease VapC
MNYLLDTDTLVYLVRGLKITTPKNERQNDRVRRAKRIVARSRRSQEGGDAVSLSAITVAELEYGARKSGDYATEIAAVRKILAPFLTADFDPTNCAEHYGAVRHTLEIAGATIGAMDMLIASPAKALGATLVTNNLSRFARIAGFSCENWSD